MGDRWRPIRLRNGAVIQSGLGGQDRYQRVSSLLDPVKRPFRALVIASRVVGEEGQVRNLCVEVDVLLVRTQILVQNVPVVQRQHGINNVHSLWVPRPTTRTLNDTVLNLDRQLSRRGLPASAPPTPLDQCDGDMVLLDFIEGDLNWPIVTHALTHERTNRLLRAGAGWREGSTAERGSPRRDEHYIHHYGCEIRVNEQGDFLIDTVGAYSDPATEDTAAPSGQVRIRVKESQRLTIAMGDDEDVLEVWKDGGQLRIDLGEGAAERIPLGDSLKNYIDTQIQRVNTFWTTIFNLHKHPGVTVGVGVSSVPDLTQVPTLDPMPDSTLSDLARTKKS